MRVSWKWVVLWSLWAARLVRQPTAPLRASGGLLRGDVAPDGSHRGYLALPYATLHTHSRFQDPGEAPTWPGIFEAVNEHIRCPQELGFGGLVMGQLNCLTLNVYTPINASPEALLPVMFYIHGGGFFEGSGSSILFGPDYLVSKNVLVVTFNYRLNVLGFLCLGIKEAPGNAGLKDQVAALKWVQRNIKAFGGDPDNVTIFGESAGAASVSYHILSPMSQGLFHKAILQSGSSIAAWSHQYRPDHVASSLAKAMGYEIKDPNMIYNILETKSTEEIVTKNIPRPEGETYISVVIYAPCVEQVIEGVQQFLTDLPYNILAKGEYNKVPMILGSNVEEGFFFVARDNKTMLAQIKFENSLPKDLVLPSELRKEIADAVKKMYLDEDDISEETRLKLSRFYGETFFNYPALEETELLLQTNDKPVYNYLFNYDGWRNFAKLISGTTYIRAPGSTHADELFYLFKLWMLPSMFETKMIDRMTTMWTNFAKYGDPTPSETAATPVRWPPTDQLRPRALVIDRQLRLAPLWFRDSILYWRQLYAKYRRRD